METVSNRVDCILTVSRRVDWMLSFICVPQTLKAKRFYITKDYLQKFNLNCCDPLREVMKNERESNLAVDYMWHSYFVVVGGIFYRYDCRFRRIDNRLWFTPALAEKSEHSCAWNPHHLFAVWVWIIPAG